MGNSKAAVIVLSTTKFNKNTFCNFTVSLHLSSCPTQPHSTPPHSADINKNTWHAILGLCQILKKYENYENYGEWDP